MSDAGALMEAQKTITHEPTSVTTLPPTRGKVILRIVGWVFFGIGSLLFFTLMKLPEDRLRAFVHGSIASVLAQKGIGFSAGKSHLSIGFGVRYEMNDVVLTLPPPDSPARIERLAVSPSILPMILKKLGGRIWIENAGGKLVADVSVKGSDVSAKFDATSLDLGKLGLLPALAAVRGSAVISGTGNVSGDFAVPSTLTGDVDLELGRISLDAQPIAGFAVPKLSVSDGKLEVSFDRAKATIKTLRLGKAGSTTDDITANLSGDVTLGKQWESSTMNVKANFTLSPSILKSFVILDALLGAGKTGEGAYAFQLTGPLSNPIPAPLGGK
jgi:type II secretion system protein N